MSIPPAQIFTACGALPIEMALRIHTCWFLSVTGRNLTFCELQREIDSARSKDFIPRCKEDGRFEELQCQRMSGECWCVDEAGMEIPESRTVGLPNCDKPVGKCSKVQRLYHSILTLFATSRWCYQSLAACFKR